MWTNETTNPTYMMRGWQDVVALPNGDFVTCGALEFSSSDRRGYVRCWGPGGGTRWTHDLNPTNMVNPLPQKLAVDPDGNIIVMGVDELNDPFIVKIGANGVELDRNANAGPSIQSEITNLVVAPDGKIYASMEINGFAGSVPTLASYGNSLGLRWSISDIHTADIEVSQNGNIVTCGNEQGQVLRARLVVLTPSGVEVGRANLTEFGAAYSLSTNNSNDIFVTDTSGQLHKFNGSVALVLTTILPFIEDSMVDYHEPTDTLYVTAIRISGEVDVAGYSSSLVQKWRKTTSPDAVSVNEFKTTLDRYGNLLVAATTDIVTGRNFGAYCFDPRGRLMWSNELREFDTTTEEALALAVNNNLQLVVVGSTDGDDALHYHGLSWRTSQYFHAPPDDVTVRLGRRTAGDLESLVAEDGDNYTVCKFIVPNQQVRPIVVDFAADFPIGDASPGSTDLTVRARCSANTTGLGLWLQAYDWQAGGWTSSATDTLTTGVRSFVRSFPTIDKYLESGTQTLRARIAVAPTGPVSTFFYCINVDLLEFQSNTQ